MESGFNAYHQWLGIPPKDQPPHHYRLLGVELFENDPGVIESAADRQMAHVRSFQTGKHGAESQRLLNEIAAAKVCLLKPATKAEYDASLKARLPKPPHAADAAASKKSAAPIVIDAGTSSRLAQRTRKRGSSWQVAAAASAIGVAMIAFLLMRNAKTPDPPEPPGAVARNNTVNVPPAARNSGTVDAPVSDASESAALPSENTVDPVVARSPAIDDSEPPSEQPASESVDAPQPTAVSAVPTGLYDQELLQNPGCEEPPVNGNIPGWVGVNSKWRTRSRAPLPEEGQAYFFPGPFATAELFQDVFVGAFAATIDEERQPFRFAGYVRVHDQKPSDTSRIVLEFRDESNLAVLAAFDSGTQAVHDHWKQIVDERVVPRGTRWIRVRLISTRAAQKENDGYYDDLSLQAIEPPADRAGSAPLAGRLPVPDDEALLAANEKIAATFGAELEAAKTQPAQIALSEKFLNAAQDPATEPVARFALLQRSADLASEAGQYALAGNSIDLLGQQFEFDALTAREEALKRAVSTAKSQDELRKVAECWRDLAKTAADEDRFDLARAYSDRSTAAARDVSDKVFVKSMADAMAEIKAMQAAYALVASAKETLQAVRQASSLSAQENGTSSVPRAQAAAVWGRYCCLYKNDWANGLPLWASGEGDDLVAVAKLDQADPASAEEQLTLADGWWEAAEKQTEDLPKKRLQRRAASWYRRAQPRLSGLDAERAKNRFEESERANSPFQLGEWVELLDMVDPARHGVAGQWMRRGQEVAIVQPIPEGRIMIPVQLNGSYELDIRFTVHKRPELQVVLPVATRSCVLSVGAWDGTVSGLSLVDGKQSNANASTVRAGRIPTGREHRLECRIQVNDPKATIEVDFNSRSLIRWQGLCSSLSILPQWALPNAEAIGLGGFRSITYHSVKLRLTSGTARPFE